MKLLCKLLAIISISTYADTDTSILIGKSLIESGDGIVAMTEHLFENGQYKRQFTKAETVLYMSKFQINADGLSVEILAGHPSQLGRYIVKNGVLEVYDSTGVLLWTEKLKLPICPPELSAEFVRANWDSLVVGGKPLKCVIPIIKAKKVAPVQWVRLPDTDNSRRVVEIQPASFGMRFFLSPTQLIFDATGMNWISQNGQFESTRDPARWPRYLKGKGEFTAPRQVIQMSKSNFSIGINSDD